jgi:3'-phosphoadenosine 5'-phosphosulfate sulfotransferase (PAPS reductase)/FAD synthetase
VIAVLVVDHVDYDDWVIGLRRTETQSRNQAIRPNQRG